MGLFFIVNVNLTNGFSDGLGSFFSVDNESLSCKLLPRYMNYMHRASVSHVNFRYRLVMCVRMDLSQLLCQV